MTIPEPITILMVEDNPDHVFLAKKAIGQEMGERARIYHAGSGEDALVYLRSRSEEAPRPDLVLLDLMLPGQDGFSVVREMKSDPALRSIPVVIFTSSDADSDILRGYDSGSNIYVCKPTGLDEFAERLRAIPAFFSQIAHLPPREQPAG